MLTLTSYAESIVSDPQQHYLQKKIPWLYQDDNIFKFTLDLNEDGVEDYFFSSTAKEDVISRRGAKSWKAYLSTPQGYVEESGATIDFHTSMGSVLRLDNGRLALASYSVGGQNSNVYEAFYADDNNRLHRVIISRLVDGVVTEQNMRTTRVDIPINKKYFPLSSLLSPEQLSQVKSRSDDFLYKKTMVSDYDDPKLYYIYSDDLEKFYGIKEEMREKVITLDVIDSHIKELLERRAMARLKNKELTSEQDQQDLQQIQQWYESWHDQHGSYRLGLKKIESMTAEQKQQQLALIGGSPIPQGQPIRDDIKSAETEVPTADNTQSTDKPAISRDFSKTYVIYMVIVVFLVMAIGAYFFLSVRRKKGT